MSSSLDRITLRRSGDAPLSFTGVLIVSSEGRYRANREYSRYHDLSIYHAVGEPAQPWVLHIEYVSRYQGETGYSQAFCFDHCRHIAPALASYDPCARVRGFPDGEHYAAKQARLLEEIRSHYQEQVSDLLEYCNFTQEMSDAMANTPVTSFRPDEQTRESVARLLSLHGYENATEAISISVQGWEMGMILAQPEVEALFSRAEWNCMADVLNGTLWTFQGGSRPGMLIAANVEDGHRLEGLGDRWFPDAPNKGIKELTGKLYALTFIQAWAVIGAVRWFWANCEQQFDHQTDEWWTLAFRRERRTSR